jgi:anti-sigma factor RsiW
MQAMKCDKALALIVDSGEGPLPESGREALEAHLHACKSCKAAMSDFESSRRTAERLFRSSGELWSAPEGFDERARNAISAAGDYLPRRTWALPLRLLVPASVAIAAAIAIVIGVHFHQDALLRNAESSQVEIPLASSTDYYVEASSAEDLDKVADILFREEFTQAGLEMINGAIAEDVEEQIGAMDLGTLGHFNRILDGRKGAGKSG